MEVLSYSVEKINSIHEDLKKNNEHLSPLIELVG